MATKTIDHEKQFLQRVSLELLRSFHQRHEALSENIDNLNKKDHSLLSTMRVVMADIELSLDDLHEIEDVEELKTATQEYCRKMNTYMPKGFALKEVKAQLFYEIAVED